MKHNRLLSRVCNPRGFGELASLGAPPSHMALFQRRTVRWFKAAKSVFVLTVTLMACVCLSPSLHGGIIYQTGGPYDVSPGGTVSVPITVNSSGLSGANWMNAEFTISWGQGVLDFKTVTLGSALATALVAPTFDTSTIPGQMHFYWADTSGTAPGIAVSNGDTLFSINFTAVGGLGSSTTLSQVSVAPVFFRDNSWTTDVSFTPGTINVVPEPINWALGLFACVFIGTATVRWISRRRTPLQSL